MPCWVLTFAELYATTEAPKTCLEFAMKPLNFREVAELVNNSKNIFIEPVPREPKGSREGGWELYHGEYRVHTSKTGFRILYLQSGVTERGLTEAKRKSFSPGHTQVVYAPSLDNETRKHKDLFEREASGFWTLGGYMESVLTDEYESYKNVLKNFGPTDYVEPQVITPRGVRLKSVNPLYSFLVDSVEPSGGHSGILGVLLAGPGQGKTYMTQFLVDSIVRYQPNRLPIYIRSDQWPTMFLADAGLWKTISHSFRHFGTPIGWIEDCEDQFIRTSLKTGLVTIIFDGLDEYLLRNRDRASASDVLSALIDLVSDTGARILVTSRTTLWNAEFASEVEQGQHDRQISVYEIVPFDQNHARNYFRKKLANDTQVGRASELFAGLSGQASDLIGRGFVVYLIADLFARGHSSTEMPAGKQPLLWLMEALCNRECERQNLRLSASEQLAALRTFFAEVVQDQSPDSELLSYSIELVTEGLNSEAVEECVKKMSSHPLLHCVDSERDEWQTSERQIQMALLADYVIDIALQNPDDSAIENFCQRGKLNQEHAGLLSEMIIELIFIQFGHEMLVKQTRDLISNLSRGCTKRGAVDRSGDMRRLLMTIVMAALDRLAPRGTDRRDRRERFVEMLPDHEIRAQHFVGSIVRMDFSGCKFTECVFEEAKWANCKFDQQTEFFDCHFVGGSNEYCDGFGLAKWGNVTGNEAGLAMISSAQVKAGKRGYNREDLLRDVKSVIDKFIEPSRLAFKTIKKDSISRGPIGNSINKELILREIERCLLETHRISGGGLGFHIRDDAKECIKFYGANNQFTGPLDQVYRVLENELISQTAVPRQGEKRGVGR